MYPKRLWVLARAKDYSNYTINTENKEICKK